MSFCLLGRKFFFFFKYFLMEFSNRKVVLGLTCRIYKNLKGGMSFIQHFRGVTFR